MLDNKYMKTNIKTLIFSFLSAIISFNCNAENILPLTWNISFRNNSCFTTRMAKQHSSINTLLSWERQRYFAGDGDCELSNIFNVSNLKSQYVLHVRMACDVNSIVINGDTIAKDIRNQFKLITKGDNTGFKETLDVNNIEHTFREVQKVFNEWVNEPESNLADFYNRIKESSFFRLTDHLLVARTRKNVKANFDNSLLFPKHKKPLNFFETPLKFGDVENFAELMDNLDLNLSAYLPATYLLSSNLIFF